MWVLDLNDKKFYVYEKMGDEWSKRDDGTKNKEFGLVMANSAPGGIWSDKTTMWVSNNPLDEPSKNKIYAYNMWTTNQQKKL